MSEERYPYGSVPPKPPDLIRDSSGADFSDKPTPLEESDGNYCSINHPMLANGASGFQKEKRMKIEIKLPKKSTVLRYMGVMQLLFTFFALWFFKPVLWYCKASGWSPEVVHDKPALFGMWVISLSLCLTWFIMGGIAKDKEKKKAKAKK
jgi:hypothetical protein